MIKDLGATPARPYRAPEELITTVVRHPHSEQVAQALLARRVANVLGTTPDMQTLRTQCPDAVRELWPLESLPSQFDTPDSYPDADGRQDVPYPSGLFRN